MSYKEEIFLGAVALTAIALFLWGIGRHFIKYRRGSAHISASNITLGIKRMVTDLLTHRTLMKRDRYAGYAHAGIFFGFGIVSLGVAVLLLEIIRFLIIVHFDVAHPVFYMRFWEGDFYLIFSLGMDLGHLALIIGILMMMWRRYFSFEQAQLPACISGRNRTA